jgi:hypothetical protein
MRAQQRSFNSLLQCCCVCVAVRQPHRRNAHCSSVCVRPARQELCGGGGWVCALSQAHEDLVQQQQQQQGQGQQTDVMQLSVPWMRTI